MSTISPIIRLFDRFPGFCRDTRDAMNEFAGAVLNMQPTDADRCTTRIAVTAACAGAALTGIISRFAPLQIAAEVGSIATLGAMLITPVFMGLLRRGAKYTWE